MSSDDLRQRPSDILAFVDGHVRFAEAKHTALFTANVAGLAAAIAVAHNVESIELATAVYLGEFLVLSAFATVTTLLFNEHRLTAGRELHSRKLNAESGIVRGEASPYFPNV